MEITRTAVADTAAVLAPRGRLDLVTASRLRAEIAATVAEGRPRVVVDLEGVTFVDSSGLGALIAGLKVARDAGGELRIANAGKQAVTVLSITRLDRVLRQYPSVDEALAGF